MAPIAPLGKKGVQARLRDGRLPFTFGSPHPVAAVVEQDGVFRLRALAVDPAEAHAASSAEKAAGRPWTPEQHYALGRPTGEVFLEAASRDALAEAIETYPWPPNW